MDCLNVYLIAFHGFGWRASVLNTEIEKSMQLIMNIDNDLHSMYISICMQLTVFLN